VTAVSVIIPTYNRVAQLMDAVRSVKSQTFPPAEFIIVDDGSTDNTEKAFENEPEPVRYIRIDKSGVSTARNTGIAAARGDWIAFLDSDDKWHATKLERQIRCVENTKARVCYTGSATESGMPLDHVTRIAPGLAAGHEQYNHTPYDLIFRHGQHPLLPTMLVEKQALESVGRFDESLYCGEDTKLIYELAFLYGAAYINEPLVTVSREREVSGLSDSFDPRLAAQRFQCALRVLSEAYWRLLDIDLSSARALRKNIADLSSRRAEIACVLREDNLSSFAKAGLLLSGDWKTFVRSLVLLLAPSIARPRLKRKWRTG
jgi:glycosyltransferase involved in cell wall biosynthesis